MSRIYFIASLGLALLSTLPACNSKERQAAAQAPTLYKFDQAKPLRGEFSAAKAMAHIEAQVAFGPRPAGTEALGKCRNYLQDQLQAFGWEVQPQAFERYTPKGNIKFTNLRARLPITGSDTWERPCAILVGSHFDTKLFGAFEFLGANDGASSTGMLLEFARVLSLRKDAGQFIELVFFDGEEAMVKFDQEIGAPLPSDGLYGSRYYVETMRKLPSIKRPLFFVLLDMVGDKDLKVEIPENSSASLTDLVLTTAGELNFGAHFGRSRGAIIDDHIPFLHSGIKSVDIIDLDYKPWHTSSDKLDQLSEKSLEIVGQTTLQVIEKLLSTASE